MIINKEYRNTKILTVISIIILPLSILFDIYLFNVNHLPVSEMVWMFPVSIIIGLFVGFLFAIVTMYLYRKKWDETKKMDMRIYVYGRVFAAVIIIISILGVVYLSLPPATLIVSIILGYFSSSLFMIKKKGS